jgi:GlpG protein
MRQVGGAFGGMSGVGYGLFGYLFIKTRYDNRDNYLLSPVTSFVAIVWFIVCIARSVPPFSHLLENAIPPIANSAHAVGLFVGAAMAYVPMLLRRPA